MRDTKKGIILNDLRFNIDGVMNDMRNYMVDVMHMAEMVLIDRMSEMLKLSNSAKESWKDEACRSMKAFNEEVVNDMIHADVGIDMDIMNTSVRAVMVGLITAYGSGDQAKTGGGLGERIYAGPLGRIVWNGDQTAQQMSAVVNRHDMPKKFNMKGNGWVDNAMKDMEKYFSQILLQGWNNMPASVFYDNLTVS